MALQADAQKQVPLADPDQLPDHRVDLLRLNVFQNVRAKHEIELVILVRQVGQAALLHDPFFKQVGALRLEDRPAQFNPPGALPVRAHLADEDAVPGACVEDGVKGHPGDDVSGEAAAPAALLGVPPLEPGLVVHVLVVGDLELVSVEMSGLFS
jgi:hypothetical protein